MTKRKVKYEVRGRDELSKVTTKLNLFHQLLHALGLEGASLHGWDE